MTRRPFRVMFKPGVVAVAHPLLWRGLYVVSRIIYDVTKKDVVITSMWDQSHSLWSLHYCGCAADIRSKIYSDEEKEEILTSVRNRLDSDYDFILESDGEPNEHFHLEWDKGKFDRKGSVKRAWGVA